MREKLINKLLLRITYYLRKIKYGLKNDRQYIFWTTSIFYFSLYFNLNNKTLLLAFFILIVIYYLRLKDFSLSTLFAWIASLPILVGKNYIVNLIPAITSVDIGININQVLNFMLLLLLIRDIRNKKINIKIDIPLILLSLFQLWMVISAITASRFPEISLTYALQGVFHIQGITILIPYIYIRYFLKDKSKFYLFFALFISGLMFESIWTIAQYLHKAPLGRSIEAAQSAVLFGYAVDEDIFQFRPLSTFAHANQLAIYLLPLTVWLFSKLYLKPSRVELFIFTVSVVSLILTWSRSSWISLSLGLLLLTYILEKKIGIKLKKRVKQKLLPLLAIGIILFPIIVNPRIQKSFYTFQNKAGGSARIQLMKESMELIREKPLFGTGIGMGVFEGFLFNPGGVLSYFPTIVHHAYVHLALEIGIVGFLLYLWFLIFAIKKAIKKIKLSKEEYNLLKIGALIGIISIIINQQMQPLYYIDTTLLVILLALIGV